MTTPPILVPVDNLRQRAREALLQVGVPADHAEMAAELLVTADLQGISSHGTIRLPTYVKRIRAGLINPNPELRVSSPSSAVRLLDGDNGLGPVVGMTGLQIGIEVARSTGVCCVACKRSNHFGPGAPFALAACRQNMVVWGTTNAFPTLAPTGSFQAILGNNPIFVGSPRRNAPHFILDMAMSVVARGKLRAAAQRGDPIPEGWATDSVGRPTRDPQKGLEGLLLPVGGYKGYGLALAMEILAGVLTGSGFATDVLSMYQQWEKPQNVGHLFIVLDPSYFMPLDTFFQRLDGLLQLMCSATPIDPSSPVSYPGEHQAAAWDERLRAGIPLDQTMWNSLRALAQGSEPECVPGF